jgi:Double-GTPase 2
VAFTVLAIGVLASEKAMISWNHIRVSCPYGPCGKPIRLPEYICPGCKIVHRDLEPGIRTGIYRHICECGASLPTTILLGRYRLAARCPHCQTSLPGRIGRVPVVELPFVGGTAAGKSTLLNLMVDDLRRRLREEGGRFDFVNPWDIDRFKEGRAEFRNGYQLAKTLGEVTRAVVLEVAPPGRRGRLAYFFDLSGEVLAESQAVRRQPYLSRTRALAVVVDPLAMPEVLAGLTEEEKTRVPGLDNSDSERKQFIDPASIIHRITRVRSDEMPKLERVAVIVTKKDIMAETGIGAPLATNSEPVESWLERLRLRNQLDVLRQRAEEVRYLASGFDDDGSDLLDLLRWTIALDSGRRFRWRWLARRRAPTQVRRPWPARKLEDRIPPSYRLGRMGLLSGFTLAAIIAPACFLSGLAYVFAVLF